MMILMKTWMSKTNQIYLSLGVGGNTINSKHWRNKMNKWLTALTAALAGLTSDQLRAVSHTYGTLLVFAGAGSGKTRVIVLRAARLILDGICAPENMMLCTFTTKAASHMRSMLEKFVGKEKSSRVTIGTMHSICFRLLKVRKPTVLIDDTERSLEISKLFADSLGIGLTEYEANLELRNIASAISGYKNNLVTPEKALGKYAEHYRKYSAHMESEKKFDFDELIYRVVKVLERPTSQEYLARLQQVFKFVFVDEFQDTNLAQAEFIKLMSGGGNLCVVGDDDQAIYGWRGAKVDLIQQFVKQHPDAMVVNLMRNFRSFQNLLDAAFSVVRHVLIRAKSGSLESDKSVTQGSGPLVFVQKCQTCYSEAMFIAREIARLHDEGKSYSDCAILVRMNSQKIRLQDALKELGIPFADSDEGFFTRKEIAEIMQSLRYSQHSMEHQEEVDRENGLNIDGINYDLDLVNTVENLISASGYDLSIDSEETRALIALGDLVRHNKGTVYSFLEALHQGVVEEPIITSDKVLISTVHGAKGLEFPYVFLAGMENGIFPTRQALKNHDGWLMDEERRLAYVAITRAMEKLCISYCESREKDFIMQEAKPSMFLSNLYGRVIEIGEDIKDDRKVVKEDDLVVHAVQHTDVVEQVLPVIGDKVTHALKGEGVLLKIMNKGKHAEVKFKSAGKLTVMYETLSMMGDMVVDISLAQEDEDIVFVN